MNIKKKTLIEILNTLSVIRIKLEDIQNCEDSDEMVTTALELACDLQKVEESFILISSGGKQV